MGPGRRRVEIEFTACSFRAPGRVKFQYKLGGFDPQWTVVTGRRAAVYDNLPPGRYEFRVTARDGSVAGASSEAGMVLVVQPHFYQTFWFYALAVAFAGVCAVRACFCFRSGKLAIVTICGWPSERASRARCMTPSFRVASAFPP